MIPDKLFDALNCGARAAVADAWHHAFRRTTKPDEVDHVFAMAKFGTPALVQHWSSVLVPQGIALRVTGVFCHQTPKARYSHPDPTFGASSPELADLLVVHQHKAPDGPRRQMRTTRRAALIQAKMVSRGVPKSGKVDAVQEYLYQNWPDFELIGLGPGNPRFLSGKRNLRSTPNPGSYALIEKATHAAPMPILPPYCCAFPWTIVRPRQPVRTAGGEDAGAFITNMLYRTPWWRGRMAGIPPRPLMLSNWPGGRNNHFDVTVEELLDLTARKTVEFKHRGHLRGPRGYSFCFCQQLQHGSDALLSGLGKSFAATGGEPPVPTGEATGEDFGDGMSTLLIETGNEG